MPLLALFAFLLAASPAPAQSPAILLDIKSPATASPPNESLLTINDQGDVWIKGQLYEYPSQSTISLDSNTDYWTLRNAAGNVVWALEAYNHTTGVSSGNLHIIYKVGSLADADQSSAIARFTNSAGQVVLSVGPLGQVNSTGNVVNDLPTYVPISNFLNSTWENKWIPQPLSQVRLIAPGTNYLSEYPNYDVTGTSWRLRWDPANDYLDDYGITWYLRHMRGTPPAPVFDWDEDVHVLPDGGAYVASYDYDTDWSYTALPDNPTELPTAPTPLSITATNTITPPAQGNRTDDATVAKSTLYLYGVQFPDNMRPVPTAIPRKSGDASVSVGCKLLPSGAPGFDHIKLTLWDPALPFLQAHSCTFTGPAGNDCPTFTWNGILYDGYDNPWYTQASDIFMFATVYWKPAYLPNPLDPNHPDPKDPFYFKAWESAGPDYFDESRRAIVVEDDYWGPVSADPYNFAWITPGSVTVPPQMPFLYGYIVKNGDAVLPATASWNLTITFPRPDNPTSDITNYPATGSTSVPGNQAWTPSFGTDIRGGEALFTCAFGSESPTHKVHIRGRNPIPDSIPETYIDNNCGVHWYAKRIARYESHVWVPEGNPEYNSASGGADYNQFYPWNFGTPPQPLPNQNPLTRQYGGVVHDDSYGWGFFQLTNPKADKQQVWDWKANTAQAMVILGDKRQEAVAWVASQRAQMHTYRSGQSPPEPDLPIPAHPYGTVTFGDAQDHPADDACTIQAYYLVTLWVLYWDNNAVPVPVWKWRTDSNAAYVVSVCS